MTKNLSMKRIVKQLIGNLSENNTAAQQYFLPIMSVKIKILESTLLNAGVGGVLCVCTIFALSYLIKE